MNTSGILNAEHNCIYDRYIQGLGVQYSVNLLNGGYLDNSPIQEPSKASF